MTDQFPRTMVCEPATRPLRICVIYSRLPFPMMRGDQLTVAHLLSYLHARGHEVDFFTLGTGGELSPEQRTWLESVCRRVTILPHGVMSILSGVATALLKRLPIQVGYFKNARLSRVVREAVEQRGYDIVYNYYLRTAYAVPDLFASNRLAKVSGKPVAAFLALQLSQTLNTRRIYENERGLLKKLFYGIEFRLLRRYEATVWQRFTKAVLIGQRDVNDVKDACRLAGEPEIDNFFLAAHGTDVERFRPAQADEVVPNRVVFSGNMQYQPNVQAGLWFVEHCWSAIRARVPNVELYIVGKSPAPSLQALHGRDGIHVTGAVPDIGDYIRGAAVCVNPMLAAGGMQNKLIEYMACSKAVVATSIANEGIGAPSHAVLIADDPAALAGKIVELLEDPVGARRLGIAARDYVVSEWTWEAQFDKLEGAFYGALTSSPIAAR